MSHYRVGRLFVRSNVPALRREARLRRALEGCLVTGMLMVLGLGLPAALVLWILERVA